MWKGSFYKIRQQNIADRRFTRNGNTRHGSEIRGIISPEIWECQRGCKDLGNFVRQSKLDYLVETFNLRLRWSSSKQRVRSLHQVSDKKHWFLKSHCKPIDSDESIPWHASISLWKIAKTGSALKDLCYEKPPYRMHTTRAIIITNSSVDRYEALYFHRACTAKNAVIGLNFASWIPAGTLC